MRVLPSEVSPFAISLGGDARALLPCVCALCGHKDISICAKRSMGGAKWVQLSCDCGALMDEACWRKCLAATKRKRDLALCAIIAWLAMLRFGLCFVMRRRVDGQCQ